MGLSSIYSRNDMKHKECVSNRGIKVVHSYTVSRLGQANALFDGLEFPEGYSTAEDFFLDEDQWTTHENLMEISWRAKRLTGDDNFFYNCGFSSAELQSWGRLRYFTRVWSSPSDAIKRISFFSKTFSDIKEFEVISPPEYHPNLGKVCARLKIEYHDDFDANLDYQYNAFVAGIISSIPIVWKLPRAAVIQTLFAYDPEVVFNQDPEFKDYNLDVQIEDGVMKMNDPKTGQRDSVGRVIILEPEMVNGKPFFAGKYREKPEDYTSIDGGPKEAVLITKSVSIEGREILSVGQIYKAPYSVLDVSYARRSVLRRLFGVGKTFEDDSYVREAMEELRQSVREKNRANSDLKESNAALQNARDELDLTNRDLEKKVEERTSELRRMKDELQEQVETQVNALKRYEELRRYLSPKLSDIILNTDGELGAEPRRIQLTIVFTDIRGFSNLTDSIEPEELFQLLSNYFSRMTDIVYQFDGTLNKMIGDGLLVFFGDPVLMDDHADRAVNMAIEMQRAVVDLMPHWERFGHNLGVGVGINTGYVTVGSIGSDEHRDYTIIGNQVNVASRLEHMAQPGEILISQRTCGLLNDTEGFKEVGEVVVKGIHKPVKTFLVPWQSAKSHA